LFWLCACTYRWLAKAQRKNEVQRPVTSTILERKY
jgi:hypothetical protein